MPWTYSRHTNPLTNPDCTAIASCNRWFQSSRGSIHHKGLWSKQNHLAYIWGELRKIAEESHGIWSVNGNPTLNTSYVSVLPRSPSLSFLIEASYLKHINKNDIMILQPMHKSGLWSTNWKQIPAINIYFVTQLRSVHLSLIVQMVFRAPI